MNQYNPFDIPKSSEHTFFQKVFSTEVWSSLAFVMAASLAGHAFYELWDATFNGKSNIAPAIAQFILAVTILAFGILIISVKKKRYALPFGWESLPSSVDNTVESPEQARYVIKHMMPRRANIVAGASGSGKSTLFKTEVRSGIETERGMFLYVDDYTNPAQDIAITLQQIVSKYGNFSEFNPDVNTLISEIIRNPPVSGEASGGAAAAMEKLADLLAHFANKRSVYVVFDQFEPTIASFITQPEVCELYMAFMRSLLNSGSVYFAIVVRKEWACDTQKFLESIEAPSQLIILPPAVKYVDKTDLVDPAAVEAWGGWIGFYIQHGIDRHVAVEIVRGLAQRRSGFLKIEARLTYIVLKAIYRCALNTASYRAVGGLDGLIEQYFNTLLAAAPSENVATKILIALATDNSGFGITRSAQEICLLIHEEESAVAGNLRYLEACGVIQLGKQRGDETNKSVDGHILRHDYVADYVRNSSSIRVNTSDRDNIRIFASEIVNGRSRESFIRYVTPRELTIGRFFIGVFVIVWTAELLISLIWPEWVAAQAKDARDLVEAAPDLIAKARALLYVSAFGKDPLWAYMPVDMVRIYRVLVLIMIFWAEIAALIYIDSLNRGFLHVVGKRKVTGTTGLKRTNRFDILAGLLVLPSIYSLHSQAFSTVLPPMALACAVLMQIVVVSDKRFSFESRSFVRGIGWMLIFTILTAVVLMSSLLWIIGYGALFSFGNIYAILILYFALGALCTLFSVIMYMLHGSNESLSQRRAFYDRLARAPV